MSGRAASITAPAGGVSGGIKGVLAMALSMTLFITSDTFIKLVMRELPIGESVLLRALIGGVVLVAVAARAGDLAFLPMVFHPRVALRSSLDMVTTVFYLGALAVMPIASTTTIYMATPLITTALAVPFLGEKVGWRSWCAIVVGFLGAVVVARPDPDTFSVVAILPLLAALTGALRDISTRGIGREVPGSVVAISAAGLLVAAGGAMAPWEVWRVPTAAEIAYLCGGGLTFAAGSLLLVFAFRNAPVASISPLRYLLVLGALLSGFLVFGEVPDAWTSVGIALVVGAGLYALNRERVRSRAARIARQCGSTPAALGATVACAPPND